MENLFDLYLREVEIMEKLERPNMYKEPGYVWLLHHQNVSQGLESKLQTVREELEEHPEHTVERQLAAYRNIVAQSGLGCTGCVHNTATVSEYFSQWFDFDPIQDFPVEEGALRKEMERRRERYSVIEAVIRELYGKDIKVNEWLVDDALGVIRDSQASLQRVLHGLPMYGKEIEELFRSPVDEDPVDGDPENIGICLLSKEEHKANIGCPSYIPDTESDEYNGRVDYCRSLIAAVTKRVQEIVIDDMKKSIGEL